MFGFALLAPSAGRLFVHATSGMFVFGLVLALPGTLFGTPTWTSAIGCDVADQANLLVVFYTGQLLCTAAAGVLVDHVGAQKVLVGGSGLVAIGFLALAGAARPATTGVAFALLAAGGASINASSNTLVSVTYGERRGTMLPLLGVFCAVGACLAPFALGTAGVGARLAGLGVLSSLLTIAPLMMGDAPWSARGVTLRGMLSLVRDRRLTGLIAWLAVEFGVEAVIAGWSAAYAIATLPGANAAMVVLLYWAGLLIGRSATPLALRWSSKLVTVGVAAGLAAVGIAGLVSAQSWDMLAVAVFATGFAIGPIAPTIISVAGDRYPTQSGLAIGVLLSMSQLGGMLLPWITGRVAIVEGFRVAMLVPLVSAIVLSASAGAMRMRRAARIGRSGSEPA
jgi:fucose permease